MYCRFISIMAHSTWHLCISIFLLYIAGLNGEEVADSKPEVRPWYESLPAVAMDYKVHVDAGKEDCYYQYVQAGATFYVSFQVILGGDLQVGFVIKDKSGEHLSPYFYNNTEKWDMVSEHTDYYAMCIDNRDSRLVSKLVNIAAIVIKYNEWHEFARDFAEYNVTAKNMTESLSKIEKQIKIITIYQMYLKHQGSMDMAVVQMNYSYVQNRSLITITLIILTCSMQVIRGGDNMAGFAVRHPSGNIVHPYQWQPSSEYTDSSSTGGYYAVCIDNQFSRFAGKLVNLYITVIKYDEWDRYAKEIEALQLNMQNFTSVIGSVERNINEMLQFQSHSRQREARDLALLVDNNSYVLNWSLAQIFVILLTCALQVYFVRKLFDVKSTGSGRTRI